MIGLLRWYSAIFGYWGLLTFFLIKKIYFKIRFRSNVRI